MVNAVITAVLPGPSTGPAGPPGPAGQAPLATGSGQTVGNATVAILTWTPPLNSTTVLRQCMTDNGATAGQAYSFVQYVTVHRDGGAPRVVGSVSPTHVARDNNSAQAPIAISGNNVEFRARGVNAQTINWVCAIYRDSV